MFTVHHSQGIQTSKLGVPRRIHSQQCVLLTAYSYWGELYQYETSNGVHYPPSSQQSIHFHVTYVIVKYMFDNN